MFNAIFQKILELLTSKWIGSVIPDKFKGIYNRLNDVLTFTLDAVHAAEATGADGAAKKKLASAQLLASLKNAGIDIPGDADQQICDLFVEAVVGAINRFFPKS